MQGVESGCRVYGLGFQSWTHDAASVRGEKMGIEARMEGGGSFVGLVF